MGHVYKFFSYSNSYTLRPHGYFVTTCLYFSIPSPLLSFPYSPSHLATIKMLTELIELGWKMKKQMKDTQSEIKQNIQGTNSDRKETRTQINDLEQKEEVNIQPVQNEVRRI